MYYNYFQLFRFAFVKMGYENICSMKFKMTRVDRSSQARRRRGTAGIASARDCPSRADSHLEHPGAGVGRVRWASDTRAAPEQTEPD